MIIVDVIDNFLFHRQLIDEVVDGRENTKLVQQKLQQYKADFVKQYKEEFKQLMKQALEEVCNFETGDTVVSIFPRPKLKCGSVPN